MSRSRRKYPIANDYSRIYTKWAKRQSSKAVRRYSGKLVNGNQFKKVFCSYNIFDYKAYWNDERGYRK